MIQRKWCQYRDYRNLKERFSHIHYPLAITLHEIIGVSPFLLDQGSIHVDISVWWSPSLFYPFPPDHSSFVNTSQPTVTIRSTSHPCTLLRDEQPDTQPHVIPNSIARERAKSPPLLTRQTSLLDKITLFLPPRGRLDELGAPIFSSPINQSMVLKVLDSFRVTRKPSPISRHELVRHRSLEYENIGRDSLHFIGSNFLSPRSPPFPAAIPKPKPSTPKRTNNQFFRTRAIAPLPFPHRHYAEHLLLTETVVAAEYQNDIETDVCVDLEDEVIYLPGCPSKSQVKFTIYDGR
jgi:hypothetical protein